MPITVNEQTVIDPDLTPITLDSRSLTEEELESLEDAEDLAIAKERYSMMDRSQLVSAGTARSAS